MKYSQAFERDYGWYLQWKDTFDFDGSADYFDKAGQPRIQPDNNGKTAKECFYIFDSQGKVVSTREPELLRCLYKCKGSINFHLKAWAEGRSEGTLPRCEWEQIQVAYQLLPWMVDSCENQYRKELK